MYTSVGFFLFWKMIDFLKIPNRKWDFFIALRQIINGIIESMANTLFTSLTLKQLLISLILVRILFVIVVFFSLHKNISCAISRHSLVVIHAYYLWCYIINIRRFWRLECSLSVRILLLVMFEFIQWIMTDDV